MVFFKESPEVSDAQWYPDLPRGGETKGLYLPYLTRNTPDFSLFDGTFGGGVILPATVDINGGATGFVRGKSGGDDPFVDGGGKQGGGDMLSGAFEEDSGDGVADTSGIGDDDVGGKDPQGDPFEGVDWQGKTDRTPPVFQDYINWHTLRKEKRAAVKPIQLRINGRPVSDIGTLVRLPGEIRNRIYRLSLLNNQGLYEVSMKPNTCAIGKCLHAEAHTALPGVLTTCRQIRAEAAPIFFTENTGFRFSDQVVQQGCVPNWLGCAREFIKSIKQFNFIMKRQEVVPPGGWPNHPELRRGDFGGWAEYNIRVVMPIEDHIASDFMFYGSSTLDHHNTGFACVCPIEGLVAQMNEKKDDIIFDPDLDLMLGELPTIPVDQYLLEMVNSETFSNFVFRLRGATVGHGQGLLNCPDCLGTDFVY